MQHILAVGADQSLLRTRGLVLAGSGALVRTAGVEQGLLLLENGGFSVLVLCHSLRQCEQVRLCACARAGDPRVHILLLESPGTISDPSAEVDARFLLADGPAMLVETVRELLGGVPLAQQNDPGLASSVLPFPAAKRPGTYEQTSLIRLSGASPSETLHRSRAREK